MHKVFYYLALLFNLVLIVLVVMKLCNVLDWSWWVVICAPIAVTVVFRILERMTMPLTPAQRTAKALIDNFRE